METLWNLSIVDASEEGWRTKLRTILESGRNFFLVLANDPAQVRALCEEMEASEEALPPPARKPDFLMLSQYVNATGFNRVMQGWNEGGTVLFIDQLNVPFNRPPRCREFILYSPVWGMISQHEGMAEAGAALEHYQKKVTKRTPNPEANIYHWNGVRWDLMERPVWA